MGETSRGNPLQPWETRVSRTHRRRAGTNIRSFTLVELVVVIMIIGMIASMAIPRISQGATRANGAAIAGSINTMRKAVLYYAIEHRNKFPGSTALQVVAQLTQYSDLTGTTSPSRTPSAQYGPYLNSIPPCPIGFSPGSNTIAIDLVNSPPTPKPASGAGWIYNPNTGELYPNASDLDIANVTASEAVEKAIKAPKGG